MRVDIKLDYGAIAKIESAVKPSAMMAIDALKTEVITAQVMPFDMGDMQNNETFTVTAEDSGTVTSRLVTGSPQARRLYYHPEYNFQKVNNPNAGGEWLEPWISGAKQTFLRDVYAEFFKEKAGV